MKKKQGPMKAVYICLTLFLLGAAGCSRESAEAAFDLTDARGERVAFAGEPGKIVAVGRGAIPLVDAAYLFPEAQSRFSSMVRCDQGRGSFATLLDSDYLNETVTDEAVGPEAVAALRPDCVLMKTYMAESLGKPLEAMGIPVVCVDLESPSQFRRDIKILGTLFGNPERAEEILAWYDEQAGGVASALEQRERGSDPTVLFVYHSTKGGAVSFNLPPASWLQPALIRKAGGIPIWTDEVAGQGWMKTGLEKIAAWDPDVIFLTDYFNDPAAVKSELAADAAWSQLRAVRQGRFYAFPADFYAWDQPDSRWILAFQWMAAALHPNTAPAFRPEEELNAFFGGLYGMESRDVREEILGRLTGDAELP